MAQERRGRAPARYAGYQNTYFPHLTVKDWKLSLTFSQTPFAPRDFAKKRVLQLSRAVFWPLSCYKELKLTTKLFKGRTLRGLLIQMQNLAPMLENFRCAFSPRPTDCPWVSEDSFGVSIPATNTQMHSKSTQQSLILMNELQVKSAFHLSELTVQTFPSQREFHFKSKLQYARKKMVFQQNTLRKNRFQFKLTGPAGRFRQMESVLRLFPSYLKPVKIKLRGFCSVIMLL